MIPKHTLHAQFDEVLAEIFEVKDNWYFSKNNFVSSFSLPIISNISSSNLKIKDRFLFCLSWGFKNCHWILKLIKKWRGPISKKMMKTWIERLMSHSKVLSTVSNVVMHFLLGMSSYLWKRRQLDQSWTMISTSTPWTPRTHPTPPLTWTTVWQASSWSSQGRRHSMWSHIIFLLVYLWWSAGFHFSSIQK